MRKIYTTYSTVAACSHVKRKTGHAGKNVTITVIGETGSGKTTQSLKLFMSKRS